jgi:hypothetical protein
MAEGLRIPTCRDAYLYSQTLKMSLDLNATEGPLLADTGGLEKSM